jgi:hypothetical protein
MPPSYQITRFGVMEWAKNELEHIGRIASVKNPNLQYSYAQHTVSGMLHLRDAIKQMIRKETSVSKRRDLQKLYGQVNRALQHLITEYHVQPNAIQACNTRKVLGSINNINWGTKKRHATQTKRKQMNRTRNKK